MVGIMTVTLNKHIDKKLTFGPIKLIPCSRHMSTKRAFSERNPYPGCSIVQPRLMAADKTFGITK